MRSDGASPQSGAGRRHAGAPNAAGARRRAAATGTALLTALALGLGGTAAAQAASGAPAARASASQWSAAPLRAAVMPDAASEPRWDALTEPARGVHYSPAPVHRRHRPARPGGTGNETSTNWAGYAATAGSYTSVSASWTEPDVTCTSAGIVAFWIGLDGWGSTTVEQDGTGVDCTHGTPQPFAWWETYPANSIQEYPDPVSVGDRLTSTVTSEPGGIYDLVLTDETKGWTEQNPVHVTGARNASAEVVAEAVTTGNRISALPDFHAVDFTGSQIDGGSLQSANAQPVDMTDSSQETVATTEPADLSGDFEVDYTGLMSVPALRKTPAKSRTRAPAPALAPKPARTDHPHRGSDVSTPTLPSPDGASSQ